MRQFAVIQATAPRLGVEVSPVDARDITEIERAMTSFARDPDAGMIMTPTGGARGHREAIIALAARLKLPAVYPYRYYVTDGGLISYGPDVTEQCRRAAEYVDRILRGEKAADLPVKRRPNTRQSSISRPQRRSALPCRRRCLLPPTK